MPLGQAIGAVYETYAARHGKSRWGDKTPMYMQNLRLLERLFPDARYVHLIRDGRDAALSLLSMPRGIMTETWMQPRSTADFACQWRTEVAAARRLGARAGERYLEVRYEDLLSDTPGQLQRICEFIDLPFEAGMLAFYEEAPALLAEHQERKARDGAMIVSRERRQAQQWRVTTPPDMSRVGLWRTGFTVDEQRAFLGVAGTLLEDLGYST